MGQSRQQNPGLAAAIFLSQLTRLRQLPGPHQLGNPGGQTVAGFFGPTEGQPAFDNDAPAPQAGQNQDQQYDTAMFKQRSQGQVQLHEYSIEDAPLRGGGRAKTEV